VQLSYGGVDHSRYSFVPALLVLAVAPAATARSFDSLRARMRVARDDMRVPDATAAAAADAAVVSGWPMRFIQLNVVFLYVFSGFSKLKASGLKWTTSNTLGQAFQSKGTLIGHAMNRRPIVVALQVFTESWELSMALAFWRRTRWIVLGLGVMWQLGVLATLNIEFFGVMMTYFAFVPLERVEAWAVARLRQRAGADGRPRVVVYFDGHCPLCIRTVTFLRAADWTDRMTLVDFRREGVPEGATVERASRELLASVEHEPLRGGYDALVRLSRELVPLRPLHPVLATGAVSAIGRRAYVFVSERRAILHCPPGAACALT
jgi:predicted DCC family thiol-disulfide oxidoreductase YuxK